MILIGLIIEQHILKYTLKLEEKYQNKFKYCKNIQQIQEREVMKVKAKHIN